MRKSQSFVLYLALSLLLLSIPLPAQHTSQNVPPLFDGQDGINDPPLTLVGSTRLSIELGKSVLQSTHLVLYDEIWAASNPRSASNSKYTRAIEIRRWKFRTASDAIAFPQYFGGQVPWTWASRTDLGDRTYWYEPWNVFFVTGSEVVQVSSRDSLDQSYTASIANAVLKLTRARSNRDDDNGDDDKNQDDDNHDKDKPRHR